MHKDININVSGPVEATSQYKTVVLKGNQSFADQVTETNTKYVIKWNFDLEGGSVTIPANCILVFDGGSLSNGTIVGNDTKIFNVGDIDVFHDITTEGTFIDIMHYLPLTGGSVRGSLHVEEKLSISAQTDSEEDPESFDFFLENGVLSIDYRTVIDRFHVAANSFVKNGGTSDEVLKADGSSEVMRIPSYLDFIQASEQLEDGTIYNDRVVGNGEIFTLDMILPAGRWTYAFNLIGEDGVWFGDGSTEITIRNRDNNTVITPVSSGYDDQDTYNNASRYWLSFYLPEMTKIRIELDDPAQATLYLYRPCLNMGYNRMTIADAAAPV